MTKKIDWKDVVDENGRFVLGDVTELGTMEGFGEISEETPVSWSTFKAEQYEILMYSGPNGMRCWKLNDEGSIQEITKAVIPEAARYKKKTIPKGDSMKVGDKVKLNNKSTRLPVPIRARFREGDQGLVSQICGRVYIKVTVEKKGEVRLPASWVDKV